MVFLGRPYHFKFYKGRLSQILLCSFLNTLTQIKLDIVTRIHWYQGETLNFFIDKVRTWSILR